MNRKVLSTLDKIKDRESGAHIAEENMCASYGIINGGETSVICTQFLGLSDPWNITVRYFHVILGRSGLYKQGTLSPCSDRGNNMHDSPLGHW